MIPNKLIQFNTVLDWLTVGRVGCADKVCAAFNFLDTDVVGAKVERHISAGAGDQ